MRAGVLMSCAALHWVSSVFHHKDSPRNKWSAVPWYNNGVKFYPDPVGASNYKKKKEKNTFLCNVTLSEHREVDLHWNVNVFFYNGWMSTKIHTYSINDSLVLAGALRRDALWAALVGRDPQTFALQKTHVKRRVNTRHDHNTQADRGHKADLLHMHGCETCRPDYRLQYSITSSSPSFSLTAETPQPHRRAAGVRHRNQTGFKGDTGGGGSLCPTSWKKCLVSWEKNKVDQQQKMNDKQTGRRTSSEGVNKDGNHKPAVRCSYVQINWGFMCEYRREKTPDV